MKLTQELIVAGVFLIGSWVTLSVVASAFPPSSSSVRKALTSHAAAPKRAEPVVTSIDPGAIAAPATTYLPDEKEPAVQVVTGDLASNELYIFGENQTVPEAIIEKHPDATLAVIGGEEADVSKKIEKFTIASKNVAIRIALAKEGASKQAESDFRKLREWNEQSHHFAVEVQAKKFELPVPQLLNNELKKMAEQPDAILPNTGLDSPVDDNSKRADASKQLQHKVVYSATAITQWENRQLQAALKLVADNKKDVLLCKQEKSFVAVAKQKQQPVIAEKAVSTFKRVAATRNSKAVPALKPLDEKIALSTTHPSFTLTPGLATLAAAKTTTLKISMQDVIVPATHKNAKPAVVKSTSRLAALHVKSSHASSKKLATAASVTKRFKAATHQVSAVKVATTKPVVIKARHYVKATPLVSHGLSKVIVVSASSPDAVFAKITAPVKTVKHTSLNKNLPREKRIAHERALANVERQLATEPMIITPPPVVERRIADADSDRSDNSSPRYRRYQAQPRHDEARRRSYYQSRTVKPETRHEIENDFGDSTNVASSPSRSSESAAAKMAQRFHDPIEYSRLMQE